ncbi:hypothetical protein [Geobacter anodireducens]|uniref:hypothetical protein n=1 Tax=Geobacter soli TaxID=1510391 RepID=UPI001F3EAFEC|nr:hypothetical protein [Geobacter soli]HMN03743.1 hypothetical protein [Geobacter anodireducens]
MSTQSNELVSRIAGGSGQQNATTDQITMNLQQVSDAIDASSRGSEEAATAAHPLSAFSENLRDIAGRFRAAWRRAGERRRPLQYK